VSRTPPERNWLAALPYRVLLEVSALVAAGPKIWSGTARKLAGAVLLVALVDLNTSHVRNVIRGLVTSWQSSQTRMKMGAISAALDAEYASYARYPPPDQFHHFVRSWVQGQGEDPASDYWGSPIALSVDGIRYELWSCGRDTECGTEDDIRYRGGP
jgi:hypothetical protein